MNAPEVTRAIIARNLAALVGSGWTLTDAIECVISMRTAPQLRKQLLTAARGETIVTKDPLITTVQHDPTGQGIAACMGGFESLARAAERRALGRRLIALVCTVAALTGLAMLFLLLPLLEHLYRHLGGEWSGVGVRAAQVGAALLIMGAAVAGLRRDRIPIPGTDDLRRAGRWRLLVGTGHHYDPGELSLEPLEHELSRQLMDAGEDLPFVLATLSRARQVRGEARWRRALVLVPAGLAVALFTILGLGLTHIAANVFSLAGAVGAG